MKNWKSYVEILSNLVIKENFVADFPVHNVTSDSRKVLPHTVFTAIKGSQSDGHNYIEAATKAGAGAIIVSDEAAMTTDFNCLLVKDSYAVHALMSEHFFDYPASKMNMAGITGTNGKTTIAFLLHHIISKCGHKCGLLSTIKYDTGKDISSASRTTPEANEMQRMFAEMVDNGCQYAVMEVSSHGLDQQRIADTKFMASVFTNLTGDHLDYHGDMENYYQAKKLLFTQYTSGTAVINTDDPYGHRLAEELKNTVKVLTFGHNDSANVHITDISLSSSGVEFELTCNKEFYRVNSPLPGVHNISNLTAALSAADVLGIPFKNAIESIEASFRVPGRLEHYPSSNGFDVYVDYAHTDDALTNVLSALKPLCSGFLTVVFGCGGERDRTKRARMGAAAALLADKLIITSDNPRSEDPGKIIEEIVAGIPDLNDYQTEPDRKTAINLALSEAGPGDIVLIAGKGHENYQEINGQFLHFDDAEIVRSIL